MTRIALSLGFALGLAACGTLLGTDDPGEVAVAAGGREGGVTDTEGGSSGDAAPDGPLVPFAPSHISPGAARLDGPDLMNVEDIDTNTPLSIKLTSATSAGQVPYFTFDAISGAAVLVVQTWTVNVPVKVHGDKRLVVVASKDILVNAVIEAGAKKSVGGPGGTTPGLGAGGSGNDGSHVGGGGAGFGTAGARGEDTSGTNGGKSGAPYGMALTDFAAGSAGGKGPGGCSGGRPGGGGGGAIQLSARGSIVIAATGRINAGGGGGSGGCKTASGGGSGGGGGGSGGTIFLEAAGAITIADGAILAANGGGGGSGGGLTNQMGDDGNGGADGDLSLLAAKGGGEEGTCNPCAGGNGGASGLAPAHPPGPPNMNGGGGGGAVGRIWIRTRKTPAVLSAPAISPPPQLDTTF